MCRNNLVPPVVITGESEEHPMLLSVRRRQYRGFYPKSRQLPFHALPFQKIPRRKPLTFEES